jgi:hypothetical protein
MAGKLTTIYDRKMIAERAVQRLREGDQRKAAEA